MSTLLEHAQALSRAFPGNQPVYLSAMANVFWPDSSWLKFKMNRHNGGARRGARVAGGMAGRLEKMGFLKMTAGLPRSYLIRHEVIVSVSSKMSQNSD